MNMKRIMKKAHKIAKELVGDYAARMSFALKEAWAYYREREAKKKARNAEKTITVKYYDYKNNGYEAFKTVANSYNKENKTIDIIVPADEDMMIEKMVEYKFNTHGRASTLINEIRCAVDKFETVKKAIAHVEMMGVNNQFDVRGIAKMLGYAA